MENKRKTFLRLFFVDKSDQKTQNSLSFTGFIIMKPNDIGPMVLSFDPPLRSKESSMPKPLSFDDQPKKPEPTSASSSGPKALDFGASVKSSAPPLPTPATPKPLAFANDGKPKAPPPPPPRNFGQSLFETPLSQEERRAIDFARDNFHSVFERNEGSITNNIRQLLPFQLSVVQGWGKTALENQGELVNTMAKITREFHGLQITELLQEMLELPQKMTSGGLLARFTNRQRLLAQHKLKALGVQQQLQILFPKVDALSEQLKKDGDRLPILMVALSAAASVETPRDSAVDLCVQNRRTVLQQAVGQWQMIVPQLQSIREQLVDYQGKIEQMLTVTLPTLEMNLANSR